MEKDIPMKDEAEKRFAKPAKLDEALPMYSIPKQGPNVKTIYSEEAVKKLLSAIVKKEVRVHLANLELEASSFQRSTKKKTDWLESHLKEKKVLRGDSGPKDERYWTASQLRNVLESFGWVPGVQKREGSPKVKGKARLSPDELRIRQYRVQLGLLDEEEAQSGLDSVEALEAEHSIETKAIASLREEIGNLDEEISACEARIREAGEQKRRIADFVEKKEKALSELTDKIRTLTGGTSNGSGEANEG